MLGVDSSGKVVLRKQLARGRLLAFFGKLSPCLVGIEACSTSHHWARELIVLGHEVRLAGAVREEVLTGTMDGASA